MSHIDQMVLIPVPLSEIESLIRNTVTQALAQTHTNTTESERETEYLTVKQIAKLLGVSQVTIHQWKKDGKLRFHRFGSRVRFLRSDVLDKEKYQPGHKA